MNVQMNFINKVISAVTFSFLLMISACSTSDVTILTVWTDRAEIVSYSEVFNSQSKKIKVNVIYKEQLAQSIPPAKDELPPDLAIGSWLKNTSMNRNFLPLETIFNSAQINPKNFYPSLLSYGKKNNQQYLLPLSFNLPMMIYSKSNDLKTADSISIDLEKLQETAGKYNKKNSNGFYTHMGFGPSWKSEFLYEVAKIHKANFEEQDISFDCDMDNLDNAVNYIREWTAGNNSSTKAEQDFQFKYLYTPDYKQIGFGPSLFAYTTSDSFFTIPSFNFDSISYKWLSSQDTIIAEDNMVMTGIYNSCKNIEEAQKFLTWLFRDETQKTLLERKRSMNLDKETFGIASGFSSLISVNEKVFPMYYKNLLGHIPQVKTIRSPYSTFPPRWKSLKERVIIPYLTDSTNTSSKESVKTLSDRLENWKKQFN